MTLLFVYGTLKREQRNHRYLEQQEFIGEVETAPRYAIRDAGIFPCLIEDGKRGMSVRGELYRVSPEGIERLDFHEGAPYFYKRGPVEIIGHEGVQTYLYQRSTYFYGSPGNEWPRKKPWNWLQKLRICIARNLQHT